MRESLAASDTVTLIGSLGSAVLRGVPGSNMLESAGVGPLGALLRVVLALGAARGKVASDRVLLKLDAGESAEGLVWELALASAAEWPAHFDCAAQTGRCTLCGQARGRPCSPVWFWFWFWF